LSGHAIASNNRSLRAELEVILPTPERKNSAAGSVPPHSCLHASGERSHPARYGRDASADSVLLLRTDGPARLRAAEYTQTQMDADYWRLIHSYAAPSRRRFGRPVSKAAYSIVEVFSGMPAVENTAHMCAFSTADQQGQGTADSQGQGTEGERDQKIPEGSRAKGKAGKRAHKKRCDRTDHLEDVGKNADKRTSIRGAEPLLHPALKKGRGKLGGGSFFER